ncbi:MAG TPA: hypothetical protein VMA35_09495 [Candidatus Sulfopaludibacter sp.]|nr:hypothetical protein [Candidatus Sulfopaludibacter sp.]
MRQLIKYFLWIGCLAMGCQIAGAFSLLGPVGNANGGTEDAWQVTPIGYNPLTPPVGPPFFTDQQPSGPKNYNEGYRPNTPALYYDFDPSFASYFGVNGEAAVDQAFAVLNGVLSGQTNAYLYLYSPTNGVLMGSTNGVFNGPAINLTLANGLDYYSTNLSEFPLNTESINYEAQALGLYDIKSFIMSMILEQMGLADSLRYTWALIDRNTIAGCTAPCPSCLEYLVIQRNFDIVPSALNQIQYSPYVNDVLYNYFIDEDCGLPSGVTTLADALERPADPLAYNPPVASGHGEGLVPAGGFYTGLTRDDVGGLRFLLSTNNEFAAASAANYLESPAAGSASFITNFNSPQILYTSDYNTLVTAALTNSPAALQTLFPGLVVGANPPTYFSNVVSPNVVAYFTNYIGSPAGAPASLVVVTNYVTNIVQFYQNSFVNVVTNKIYPRTSYAYQTITVGPMIGAPAGSPFVTNVSFQPFQSNVPSGDYFIITNGSCGPNIVQTQQMFVTAVTNTIVGATNANGQAFTQNLISYFTNYAFEVQPCTLGTNTTADYQGVGGIRFIRVADYDYLNGIFVTPITNQYSMVVITNGQYVTRWFQRVVTRPDFAFLGQDLSVGGNGVLFAFNFSTRTTPNFIAGPDAVANKLAGSGTIDPTEGAGIQITLNTVGPIYENLGPAQLTGPGSAPAEVIWGSYDGTTNAPVVYPNGTSIANLAAEALIQIAPVPPNLPSGTNAVAYNVTFTATGGTSGSLSWSLASNSAGLPPGLTLSSGGVMSGTPMQRGTFDDITIQMTDSSTPPHVIQTTYSLTIN